MPGRSSGSLDGFALLGPSHLGALAVTAALAVAATVQARRGPLGATRTIDRALAAALVASALLYVALELAAGTASVLTFLPLHLCDAAIFLAAYALLTRSPLAAELLYFWAFAGTLLALVTPD